eukprot:SAG31_NODE_581_length_13927_cov_78.549899_10_plen_293_part_00
MGDVLKSFNELLEIQEGETCGPNGVLTIDLHGVQGLLQSKHTCDSSHVLACATVCGWSEWSSPAVVSDGCAQWHTRMQFSATILHSMKHHPHNMLRVAIFSFVRPDTHSEHALNTSRKSTSMVFIGEVCFHIFDIINHSTSFGTTISDQFWQGDQEVGTLQLSLSFASGEFGFGSRCAEANNWQPLRLPKPTEETTEDRATQKMHTTAVAHDLLQQLYAAAASAGNEFKAATASRKRFAAFEKEYDQLGSRVERTAYMIMTTSSEFRTGERERDQQNAVKPYTIPKWLEQKY